MQFDLAPGVDLGEARPIVLGRREFMVPPLSMRQIIALAKYRDGIRQIDIANLKDTDLTLLVEGLQIGLRRAYPAVTADALLDLDFTVVELIRAIDVILRQSGERSAPPGEAKAASPSTGSDSPPSS